MARIAVVEDEESIRQLIIEELEDVGHETFAAGDGQQGLEVIVSQSPDLIMSDITMPTMNGYQMLRKLRTEHPRHANTPFIFLSALADREEVMKGLQIGADDYITKPIDFDLMLTRVETRLRLAERMKSEQDAALAKLYKHMSQEDAPSPPKDTQPGVAADAAKAKLGDIARANGGKVVATHVETVDLSLIRQKFADDWLRVSKRVMRIAEQVISAHVGDEDIVHATPSDDFTICFHHPQYERGKRITENIVKDIRERLFGETQDQELAQAQADVHTLDIDQDDLTNCEDVSSFIEERIAAGAESPAGQHVKALSKTYQYEDILCSKVYSISGKPTALRLAGFARKFTDKIRERMGSGLVPAEALADFDIQFLERVAAMIASQQIPASARTIAPIHYATIDDETSLNRYLRAFNAIDATARANLMLNICNLPAQLRTGGKTMSKLAKIGRTRSIQIENPEQIAEINLKAQRVGIVLMDHGHAIAYRDRGLARLKRKIESAGAKLFVQNIEQNASLTPEKLGADFVVH